MFNPLLIVALGVALDNLVFAGERRVELSSWAHGKLAIILFLFFVFQIFILICGEWVGRFTLPYLKGQGHWAGLGMFVGMSFNMIRERDNLDFQWTSFPSKAKVCSLILSASLYVLVYGLSLRWLGLEADSGQLPLLAALALSAVLGFFLAIWHMQKTLKLITTLSPILVLIGALFLLSDRISQLKAH